MNDLKILTDQELAALQKDVANEIQRRMLPAQMNTLNRAYLKSTGIEDGAEWQRPNGAHNAFPTGFRVTYDGKDWESLVDGNVWEPPMNWREIVPAGEIAAWKRPTGVQAGYKAGDVVTHAGMVWTSDEDNNVFEPSVRAWTMRMY